MFTPYSQPSECLSRMMFRGSGAGGRWPPRVRIVYEHHPISAITITVVSCMIHSAFSLDSEMPLMFCHQK